jgi:nicotinamidase-related amidase
MPAKNENLDGNAPDESGVALLLIDVINDFEYPGGEALFEHALPMAERIVALKRQARQAGIPAIYINDNFGKWRSDFQTLVRHCQEEDVRGRRIVRLLRPDPEDYFVLKPKHSAFYATPLDLLLAYLKASTLILTGIAGDVCVLFTASDAFLRDYHLFVPADCVASIDPDENRRCLAQMQRTLDVDIRPSTELDLAAMKREAETRRC